ncbi:MAG: PepSY domain-containing protein, partial [Pseudomonadota bacterium]
MKLRNKLNRVSRKIHDQVALWAAIPILVIILSGLILQLKKEFHWIQPPTVRGSSYELKLSPDEILGIAKSTSEAEIESWEDVDRLDIRPSK